MKLKVKFTRRSNFGMRIPKTNRLDESVILSEGILKSVADAFRLDNLGDKLLKYAENNKSALKLKVKDLEEKLKQDGVDVKAIKAYENMYVKDVMNRREDGTFSAMIQNIIDNCNKDTEHPIARKTVCYIIMFSLLILLDTLRIATMLLPPVAHILALIILSIISINLSTKAIDGCLKQNGATIVGATLTTTLLGTFILATESISRSSLLLGFGAVSGIGICSVTIFAALFVWLTRRYYKRRYGEDVTSSKEKAKMCTLLSFFPIPTAIIHYFVDSTNKLFNINKYKSFDSEKIDEAEFYNPFATTRRRTIREAKSYSVGSARRKTKAKRSLRGWM